MRTYLRKFRRSLEAGNEVILVTPTGPVTVQIVSIIGKRFTYFDAGLNQQIASIRNVLPKFT